MSGIRRYSPYVRAIAFALAASLVACTAPSEEPESAPITTLHSDDVDGSTSASDGGNIFDGNFDANTTGTNFPAESDPEGRVPEASDDGGCSVPGNRGNVGGALFCVAAVALALVSARRRRSCT